MSLYIKNRSRVPSANRGLCLLAAAAISVCAFTAVDLQEAYADSLDAYDVAYAESQTAGRKLKDAIREADKTLDAYAADSLYTPNYIAGSRSSAIRLRRRARP